MKIPYFTKRNTLKAAKRFHNATGGIAIKVLGIIVVELPVTPVTLRYIRMH